MFGSRNFLFAKSAAASSVISGKLFMWGKNNFGTLGLGNTTNYSSPKQVGALTDWAYVEIANSTLCVKKDNTLWSWGFNSYGTLGQGNTTNRSSPVQVGALTNWKKPAIAAASAFCVKTDGTLWSWGRNGYGQLGLGNTTNYSSPKQIGSSTNWTVIVGGSFIYSVLAIENGKLFAWGVNTYGQLGLGDTTNRSSPVQVGALTTWQTPSTNRFSLCTKTDGTLWAWGNNANGELGLGNTTLYSSPKQVGALTDWSIPACTSSASICVKTNGTLWSWGQGAAYGQLGLNNATNYSSPKQVGALTNWAIPGSQLYNTVCLKTDGTLWSWGANVYGKLGLGNTTNYSSPKQIGSLTTWTNKPATFQSSGCIQGVGTAAPVNLTVPVVSGTAQEGQTLSSTTGTWSNFPTSFAYQWQRGTSNIGGATSSTYTAVAADVGSTLRCVVTATNAIGGTAANSANTATVIAYVGKLFMWGANGSGQLGLGDTTNRSSPVQVGSLTTWSKASTASLTVAVKSTGELWSWGSNYAGGLGLGNTTNYSSPKQVGALTNWAIPAADQYNVAFCIKTDGTLWAWGNNPYGQLGNGNTTGRSSPVQIGSSTNWVKISVGGGNVLAVDGDGKLFAWGKNNFGQLGLGDTTNRSSPVQVGALTNWKTPSAGSPNVLCTKTDGTLWAWGRNTSGQLGQGDTTNRSSPVQVGALTTWDVPSTGNGYVSMCVKTDNTLWIWGSGGSGKLGLGNTTSYSSPKQVGALTNWAIPSSAGYSSMCLKTDGTLWSWGGQAAGQLGLGNTTAYSSPKQIGSLTTWAVPLSKNTTAGCIQS